MLTPLHQPVQLPTNPYQRFEHSSSNVMLTIGRNSFPPQKEFTHSLTAIGQAENKPQYTQVVAIGLKRSFNSSIFPTIIPAQTVAMALLISPIWPASARRGNGTVWMRQPQRQPPTKRVLPRRWRGNTIEELGEAIMSKLDPALIDIRYSK